MSSLRHDISHSFKSRRSGEHNLGNSSKDDTFSEKKIEETTSFLSPVQFSVFHELKKPTMTLLNSNNMDKLNYERINFIKTCRESLDKSQLPPDFGQWTTEQQYDHLLDNFDKYFSNIPVSIRYMIPALFKDGDCGRPVGEKPDWLDMDKFRRGQAFARYYISVINIAQLISLFILFSSTDELKTLILSQKSNTPYRSFRRYLSTMLRIYHWYQEDPWDEETQAYQDIKAVRQMHLAMRQRVCSYDEEQFDEISEIPNVYCPMLKTIVEDFRNFCLTTNDFHHLYTKTRVKSLNQSQMSSTQFAFMGLIMLYPEKFGIYYASEEDIDAFCHMWRVFGYLLGIEDRYNFCRGSLQEVRRRCSDWLEYLVRPNLSTVTSEWEHMCTCLCEGVKYYLFMPPFKVFLFSLYHVVDLDMPLLRKSFTLLENVLFIMGKFIVIQLTMIPFFVAILNIYFRACLNVGQNFGPKKHEELRKKSRELIGF